MVKIDDPRSVACPGGRCNPRFRLRRLRSRVRSESARLAIGPPRCDTRERRADGHGSGDWSCTSISRKCVATGREGGNGFQNQPSPKIQSFWLAGAPLAVWATRRLRELTRVSGRRGWIRTSTRFPCNSEHHNELQPKLGGVLEVGEEVAEDRATDVDLGDLHEVCFLASEFHGSHELLNAFAERLSRTHW